MPARNEIVPLSTSGPARGNLLPAPQLKGLALPIPASPGKPGAAAGSSNAEVMSAQERRIKLVAQQRRHTTFQLFYGFFGLALMIVQMEYLWFANTHGLVEPCPETASGCAQCAAALTESVPVADGRMILHALRVLISFSTAIMLFYIYQFYGAECEVMKIKNIVPPKATLLSSSLRKNLMLELAVLVIHPFPGLETIDPRWPNLVVAFSLLMFARVALVVRVIKFRNSFNSSNGWFIGSLTNVDFTGAFFLKSTLKNYPSHCIVVSFMTLLGVAGYSLFVVERFLCAFKSDSCCQPMSLRDALWSLVVTILTIGYGDVVPHTGPGRFFAVMAGLCGTLLTAVTIAVMSNYLVLTRSEHKVNAFLKKDDNRRLINDHAARAIQAVVQLRAVQRQHAGRAGSKRAKSALHRAEMKLYDVLKTYRAVKRQVQSQDTSDPMDKQMTMLEMMEVNVEYIRTKIEDLSELFHSQVDKNKSKRVTAAVLQTNTQNSNSLRLPPSMPVPAAGAAATTSSSGPASSQAERIQRSNTGGITRPTPSVAHANSSRSIGSNSSVGDKAAVMAIAETPTSFVDVSTKLTASTLAAAAGANGASSPTASGPQKTAADSSTPVGSNEMPEWALMLENTLQSLLTQVNRVSSEVELIKARVHHHTESASMRLLEIERRVEIRDAMNEVMNAKSKSSLVRKGSAGLERRDSQNSNVGALQRKDSSSGSGSRLVEPSGSSRNLRRPEIMRRPSIASFITQNDLEEFQTGESAE